MFGRNVTLFELFGFKVQVNLTWVFLAVLIGWSLAQGYFPTVYGGLPSAAYWWMAVAAVVGLLFSIVFHEIAHSLVARNFGISMRGITLFMFGGAAEMEEEPPSPKAEALMAAAGPAASVVLGGAFFGVAVGAATADASAALVGVLHYLAVVNFVLAIFNSVPAFPLDGGRVLRAAMWHWGGDLAVATRLAARIGSGFGFVLIGLGFVNAITGDFIGGLWWMLLGVFLNAAARSSYYQLETRRLLEGEPVSRFMTENPVAVPPHISLRALVDEYFYRHYYDVFPVAEHSRLVGCIGLREIKAVPRDCWDKVPVGQVASPCTEENTIPSDADAVRALALMRRTGNTRLMVTEADRLVGIIVLKDLLNLLALKMDLEAPAAVAQRFENARGRTA